MKTLRNEEEKRSIIKKILVVVYYEWGKEIDEDLVTFWLHALRGMHVPSCEQAAKLLVKTKTYGEPKIADFVEVYKEKTRGEFFEWEAWDNLEKKQDAIEAGTWKPKEIGAPRYEPGEVDSEEYDF